MELDQALREASSQAHRATALMEPGEPPVRRDLRWLAAATTGLVALAGLVVAVQLAGDDGPDRLTAANEAEVSVEPYTGDKNAEVPARFVVDPVPDGLLLRYSGPVTELGDATGTTVRWVYGYADRGPIGGERPVTVYVGEQWPSGLPDGQDVDVNGVDGRLLSDGTVMFVAGDFLVWVLGGVSEDLVEVARSVSVSPEGTIVPPARTPKGMSLLGSFDEETYGEVDVGVSADAQITSYRQDVHSRHLDLVARPRTTELEQMYRWLIPAGADTITANGRVFQYLDYQDDFGAPIAYVVWFDDDVVGMASSHGIDRADLDEALRSVRIARD